MRPMVPYGSLPRDGSQDEQVGSGRVRRRTCTFSDPPLRAGALSGFMRVLAALERVE